MLEIYVNKVTWAETGPKLQEGVDPLKVPDNKINYKLLAKFWPSESEVISHKAFLCIV